MIGKLNRLNLEFCAFQINSNVDITGILMSVYSRGSTPYSMFSYSTLNICTRIRTSLN